jgi:hypothetical protein
MPCVVPTINLFSIQEMHPKRRVALGFRQGLFEGFFRTPCGSLRSRRQARHPLASTIRLIFTASIDFSARRCERIRTLNPLRAEALGDLDCHRCQSVRRDRWSGVVRIRPRDRGAFRSSRADSGPQALPPARATVPPITSSARRRIDFLTIPPPSLPSLPRRPPARPANGVTTITLARPTFLWYQGFRCRVNP